MTDSPIPPAIYIDRYDAFLKLIDLLLREPLVAIDTESNSLYSYQSRVCLIQLSTRTKDYIIDPIAIANMKPFGEVMDNPAIEKVFHAAEYDLVCLSRDFGFGIQNLFDTMIAARLLGENRVGLNSLLQEHFNINLDKSHQRDDWGKRPLSLESLRYAQMDTHYLPRLRDIKYEKLQRCGRLEEAREVFCDAVRALPPKEKFDPDGFWDLGKPHSLSRRELAILRELYLLREEIAATQDRPPFRILLNKALVALARRQPRNKAELRRVDGISANQIRRYGKEILSAIQEGVSKTLPDPPDQKMPPPDVMERYTVLHNWRKERARQRGVESNIIVTKQTLWDLAYKVPVTVEDLTDIEGLGPWRREMYGRELLALMESFHETMVRS